MPQIDRFGLYERVTSVENNVKVCFITAFEVLCNRWYFLGVEVILIFVRIEKRRKFLHFVNKNAT